MQATGYCLKGKMAAGGYTRKGVCASARKHFGKVAQVYKRNSDGTIGQFIGYFEVKDTGGQSIASGRVLDIWFPTYNECMNFGRRKIVVIFTEGKG